MTLGKTERFDEVLRLLNQQGQISDDWPLINEEIRKDKEISARIRGSIDQICVAQPTATASRRPKPISTELAALGNVNQLRPGSHV